MSYTRSMRHGEYKMPGGKLVVVDLDLRDGQIAAVQVSGDFFLEPDSALADIDCALLGAPHSASVEELAMRVSPALSAPVQTFGISAEAVAIAVRRAIDGGNST